MRLCVADRIAIVWLIPAALFAWAICGGQTPVAQGGGSVSQMIGWFFVFWLPVWLLLRTLDLLVGGPWRRAEAGIYTVSFIGLIGAAIVIAAIGFCIYLVVGGVVALIYALIYMAMQPHPNWPMIIGCSVLGIIMAILSVATYFMHHQGPEIEIIPPESRRE